jgi:hypothetical protein
MPGTMKKSDVKLVYKDANAVNWSKVEQCAGASVPNVAKQSVKDAIANKKYKKLTVKIGLIKNGSLSPDQEWLVPHSGRQVGSQLGRAKHLGR